VGWRDAPEVGQSTAAWATAPEVTPSGPKVDKLGSLGRGAAQGATFRFGDEIQGAVQALGRTLTEPEKKWADFANTYAGERDAARGVDKAARESNPGTYIAGNMAGALATAPLVAGKAAAGGSTLMRALAAAKAGATLGAITGAGNSDANTLGGVAGDTLVGAGTGAALGGGLSAIGSGVSGIANKLKGLAGGRIAAADEAIANRATSEISAEQASRAGKYGGLRQTENKAILNLLQREQSGMLDDTNRAALEQLKQSGRVGEALNESARNDLEFLATRTPEVSAAKQAMSEGADTMPQAIQDRITELGSPAEAKAQILARLKRYGMPALGSTVGTAIGGPVGGAVGALAGAGTRPMVRSIMNGMQNPAIQKQVFGAIQRGAGALSSSVPATEAELRAAALVQLLRQSPPAQLSPAGALADPGDR
jgi:hypothetical protein